MEKAVKQFIIKEVTKYFNSLKIEDSIDGFLVQFSIIPSVVFQQVVTLESYFKEHKIRYYVTIIDSNPAICFYIY